MRLSRSHTIALSNQKGGCGKTTSTVNLAAALFDLGYSVAIVDADSQCNSTQTFGIQPEEVVDQRQFTLADAFLKKKPARQIAIDITDSYLKGRPTDADRLPGVSSHCLLIVPGHRGLSSVKERLEAELQSKVANDQMSEFDLDDSRQEHRQRLRNSLSSLSGIVDFIIIDTPPDLGFLMTTALMASDWYIIPMFPAGYDLTGLERLVITIERVRKRYRPDLKLAGVLLGNVHRSAKVGKDIYQLLQEKFGRDLVFPPLHQPVRDHVASIARQTVLQYAPGEMPALEFMAVARQLLERVDKGEEGRIASPHVEISDNDVEVPL
jgi:chromosome partitioning protein